MGENITDHLGANDEAITVYGYDQLNRLTTESITLDSGVEIVSETAYDALGNVTQVTDSTIHGANTHAVVTAFEYDKLGRQTRLIRDAAGSLSSVSSSEYDAAGNLVRSTDALGNTDTFAYDRLNRLVSTTSPDPDDGGPLDPSTTTFEYDVAGNLVAETNGAGETERFVYDTLGRMVQSFDARDANQEHGTLYVYDSEGNVTSYTDRNNNLTTYKYDALNRLLTESITLAGTVATREYRYDARGNLETIVDRNGRERTFEYDNLDRQTFERWWNASSVKIAELEWQYDKLGRVTSTRDTQEANTATPDDYDETFYYDDFGRVTGAYNYVSYSATNPLVGQLFTYDQVTSADDPFVRTNTLQLLVDGSGANNHQSIYTSESSVDRLGRLSQLTDLTGALGTVGKQIDFTYDGNDQLLHTTRAWSGEQFDTVRQYDDAGRLTDLSHYDTDSLTTDFAPFAAYSYDHDLAHRITEQTTAHGTALAAISGQTVDRTENFAFDLAGQLTGDGVDTFEYDDNGNRVDAQGDIVIGAHNRLDEDADYDYLYDPEGNLTRKTLTNAALGELNSYTEYEWDHRNRLTTVTDYRANDERREEEAYRYNADDQVVEKSRAWDHLISGWTSLGTEHYVYNGGERVLKLDQNGELRHRTTWGPGIDNLLVDEVFSTGNVQLNTLWAATDHLGSVNQLLDEDGDLAEHREYDSFGNIDHVFDHLGNEKLIGSGGELLSDVAFAGREWDNDSDLYYNRARWYDSNTGRFIGVDPIEDGNNWYVYAGSDPVNYRDPTGLSAAHPLGNVTGFDTGSAYSPAGSSALNSAINVLGSSSVNVGSPSFNSGLTSQIIASGIGSSYSSTGSYGSITDFGGSSYSSGSSFSNVNSSLGSYLDPAFDFGVDQQLANGLRAYEQQQQEQNSLAFFNQIVGPDLQGIAQASVRHDNSVGGEFKQIANVGTSSAPLVSDVRDVIEVATGRDAFSGESFGAFEYTATVLGAVLPFVSSKFLRELLGATPSNSRGLTFVSENLGTPRNAAQQTARNFESGTLGAFSDVATQQRGVPALQFKNPRPNGQNFVKFDGIQQLDNGVVELIDAKTRIVPYSNTQGPVVTNSVREGLLSKSEAIKQNQGYKAVLEFPTQAARSEAQQVLQQLRINNISTRVR